MAMHSTQTDPGDCILAYCLASHAPPLVQVPVAVGAGNLERMAAKLLPSTLVQCSAL